MFTPAACLVRTRDPPKASGITLHRNHELLEHLFELFVVQNRMKEVPQLIVCEQYWPVPLQFVYHGDRTRDIVFSR